MNTDNNTDNIKATGSGICPHAELCGGCVSQGVEYAWQIEAKNAEVLRLLDANGVRCGEYRPVRATSDVYGYRNKMEYSFGDEVKDGPMTLGLHRRKSYMAVIDTNACQIAPMDFNVLQAAVLDWARGSGHGFFHKRSHLGFLRSLVLRRGERTNELLVNLVTTSEETLDGDAFAEMVLGLGGPDAGVEGVEKLTGKIVGILHTVNDRRSDVVAADSVKVLFGRDHYFEEMLGLRFRVDAFSFFQTNTSAVENMLAEAFRIWADSNGGDVPGARFPGTLYDVYCGTGTISLALAGYAEKVVGIELVPDSVRAAQENARINHIDNCEFVCGDALDVLGALDAQGRRPDRVVVDPPRMGMHPKALRKIIGYGLPQILYVSCNPKTFCENVAVLQTAGYRLETLGGYDNFPFTKHTELVGLLARQGA